MSETNKDHEEFEFIKEQILPKRHKKFKMVNTLCYDHFNGGGFGLVAA